MAPDNPPEPGPCHFGLTGHQLKLAPCASDVLHSELALAPARTGKTSAMRVLSRACVDAGTCRHATRLLSRRR